MYKRVNKITKFSIHHWKDIYCLFNLFQRRIVSCSLSGHGIIDSLSPEIYILKRLVLRWMKRRKAFLWSIERALFSVFWLIFSFFYIWNLKRLVLMRLKRRKAFCRKYFGENWKVPVFVFWFREHFPFHFFSSKVWKHLSQHNSTTLKIVSRSRAEESAVAQ